MAGAMSTFIQGLQSTNPTTRPSDFTDWHSFLGLHDRLEPRWTLLYAQAVNENVSQYPKTPGRIAGLPLRVKWRKQTPDAMSHYHARAVLQ